MRKLPFTVASALLRELGERLVGKADIALAELVKNSYDADATKVKITIAPDRIEVWDNGHGMDFAEFRDYWMCIGSAHKQEQRLSRTLKRPMTGSKGVGRLAVQFLARMVQIVTVSEKGTETELEGNVDWETAVEAGQLTSAEARYECRPRNQDFPGGENHGTGVVLTGLKHEWTSDRVGKLATEIRWLKPPFRPNPNLMTDVQKAFDVDLVSMEPSLVEQFDRQMTAIKSIWHARLVGTLVDTSEGGASGKKRAVRLSLQFAGEEPVRHEYRIPVRPERQTEECRIHSAQFEILVFHLVRRQRHGIRIQEAQAYLNKYGGIHVYDAGFHLPYYGQPEQDWLRTEMDHSHRLAHSQLLPQELQVPEGLSFLPTMSRLLGVVHVDTSREREEAAKLGNIDKQENLQVQITRDRLQDNKALEQLRDIVRYALDFYAMAEARRQFEEAEARRDIEPVIAKFERVDDVLRTHKEEISKELYPVLREQVRDSIKASETEAEANLRKVALLGPLATAGISALAYEHEVNQQFRMLEGIADELRAFRVEDPELSARLHSIAGELENWLDRARGSRSLFTPLAREENRKRETCLKAKKVVDDLVAQMGVLLRRIGVDTSGVDASLRFPKASYVEWSAIFQNVFLNAVNAMLDSHEKRIAVVSRRAGPAHLLLVQDTGCGVDLASADDLFEPFVRRLEISPERRELGYGGMGLGLTIVRMVASNLGAKVAFVQPDEGFRTAFRLSWSESR